MTPDQPCSDHHPRSADTARGCDETGFTIIEVMVVLIIIAIMMTVAIRTFGGAKETARVKSITAAAGVYAGAVGSFQLEHGNRVPVIGNQADWPAARVPHGPIDIHGKSYLRQGVPDAIADGMAGIGGPTATGQFGRIVYSTPTATTFMLSVEKQGAGGGWERVCQIGNAATITRRC